MSKIAALQHFTGSFLTESILEMAVLKSPETKCQLTSR